MDLTYGGAGPEPDLRHPDVAALDDARRAFAAGYRLTPQQADVLLQDTLLWLRWRLVRPNQSIAQALSPDGMWSLCSPTQALAFHRLKLLGIPPGELTVHQVANMFPDVAASHAILIARMPDGHRYLLDPSLRQFFAPNLAAPFIREHFYATPEGTALANTLIARGFVRLDDATATTYARAFRLGAPTPLIRVENLAYPTGQLDFSLEELARRFPGPHAGGPLP